MILFEVDAQGYVRSTPSLIPQGMALSDIVIITESDYELVTLRLIPPSGRYIPDVVCTPVKTQDKSATLWQAILPAEAAAMHGVLTYQIFRRNVQGRVIPTQEGALTVQRGVISDMPENVEHLETYSIESLYNLLSQINAKTEDHDRGIDENTEGVKANAADIDEINGLLYGYREGEPAEGEEPGAVMASVQNVDKKTETNKKSIEKLSESTSKDIKDLQSLTPSFGTITIPAKEWKDEKTTSVPVSIPANTLRNGALMVIVPANDETKTIVAEQGMSMAVDATVVSESGDKVVFERMEGSVPDVALVFRYAVIYADVADAPAVTLVGGLGGGGGNGGVYFGSDFPPPTASIWIDPTGEPSATEPWEFDMDAGGTTTKRVVVLETTVSTVTNVEGGN